MKGRSSGSFTVMPQPEVPRHRGKRRELEQGSRTSQPRPGPSKTGGKKRNLRPSGSPASTALARFLHAKSTIGLEAEVDLESAGLTLRRHAVLRYLS